MSAYCTQADLVARFDEAQLLKVASITVAGLFHSQRTGAATSALFRNGASIITSTAPSTALAAKNFGAGAYVAGGPSNFNAGLYAASFIGAGLGGKEAAFYAPIRTYMTAVGVP